MLKAQRVAKIALRIVTRDAEQSSEANGLENKTKHCQTDSDGDERMADSAPARRADRRQYT